MARLHLALTILWAILVIPTILWWRESLVWISLMSIYAIIAGHWSAYQGAHAEKKVLEKVDSNHPNQRITL